MKEDMYARHPELKGIDFVCYYRKEDDQLRVLDMSSQETVESTGALWAEAAYENILIFLNIQKSTDMVYLVRRDAMGDPFTNYNGDRQAMKLHLIDSAEKVLTRNDQHQNILKISPCKGEGQGSCKRCADKGKWNRSWMEFLYKIDGFDGCYCRECAKRIEMQERILREQHIGV